MLYNQLFVRTGTPSRKDAEDKVRKVLEVHSSVYGWSHEEPKIIPEENGRTFRVEISLTNK